MEDPPPAHQQPISPISRLLHNLGMTRDDLTRHSDQMRQFLTTENVNSLRAFVQEHSGSESPSSAHLKLPQLRTKSRSLSLVDASAPPRDTPPPVTPIKTEPVEPSTSLRRYDSMEAVIERHNRRSRKEKRYRRERETSPAPPPSPSRSVSRASSSVRGHASRRVLSPEDTLPVHNTASQDSLPPPVTPQTRRYYRDITLYQTVSSKHSSRQGVYIPRAESPSPSRSRRSSVASSSFSFPAEEPQKHSSRAPTTPRRSYYRDSLASSSPAMSTPSSSPSRHIVNIVSSPGPMGPAPNEDDYDDLPFTLPPGPYSSEKPDLPYAALIGQAILSSPNHRLTLQEIYDWITIVYPHFKRNEQTWMNSIRHVLSTTIVFRKVQRDRAEGRTLWAIWDRDLECFANGGFRKERCAEMQEQKARYATKKRTADDSLPRKTKRTKKSVKQEPQAEVAPTEPAELPMPVPQMGVPLSAIPGMSFAPLFPPRSGVHQPYYAPFSYPPPPLHHGHALPVGVIFPTLPPETAYHRVTAEEAAAAMGAPSARPSTSASSSSHPQQANPFVVEKAPSPPTPLPISSSSSMSIPGLTPNCSSSSPPNAGDDASRLGSTQGANSQELDLDLSAYIVDPDLDETPLDALAPGITLLNDAGKESAAGKKKEKATKVQGKLRKGKEKAKVKDHTPPKKPALPPHPESPTLARQTSSRPVKVARPPASAFPPTSASEEPPTFEALVTDLRRPMTPPRKSSAGTNQLSAMRTPLSHRGIHMSPSPSLMHYKSNLNPPPRVSPVYAEGNTLPVFGDEHLRTPSRRRTSSSSARAQSSYTQLTPFAPTTPRKLSFPSLMQESPFRTPGRGIFDPHDPSALLDEELARLGTQNAGFGLQESPAGLGLFTRGKGMLYESPDASSPGRWSRPW